MEPLDVFTAQDLARRPEDLFRDAEQGKLALITKDGRPVMVAVPFDERLLDLGIHRTMAVHLFESGQTTLSQSAPGFRRKKTAAGNKPAAVEWNSRGKRSGVFRHTPVLQHHREPGILDVLVVLSVAGTDRVALLEGTGSDRYIGHANDPAAIGEGGVNAAS